MYIARFSYDVLPVDRERAIDLIRREVAAAGENGMNARLLVPLTRAPGSHCGLQFEVDLTSLDQLETFRKQGSSREGGEDFMRAFSEILQSPPAVEILRVAD